MEQVEGHNGFVSVYKPFVGEIQACYSKGDDKESPTPANKREEEICDKGPRKDVGQAPSDNDILAVYRG